MRPLLFRSVYSRPTPSLVLSHSAPWYVTGSLAAGTLLTSQALVHELAYADCPKSYVFRGSKEYPPKQIAEMLGLGASNRMQPMRPGQPIPAPAASKFLLPVSAAEFQLTSILENLQRDPWPVADNRRPLRCTGVAMGVAVSLLEVSIHAPLMLTNSGRVPQHWRPYHALRRWTGH